MKLNRTKLILSAYLGILCLGISGVQFLESYFSLGALFSFAITGLFVFSYLYYFPKLVKKLFQFPLALFDGSGSGSMAHEFYSEIGSLEQFLDKTAKNLLDSSMDQNRIVAEIKRNYKISLSLVKSFEERLEQFEQLSKVSEKAADEGAQSLTQLKDTVDVMHEIKKQFEELDRMTAGIQQHLSGIRDIVMMARILSLNAAIEASHLGLSGGTIAVVAKEMTNFAKKVEETSGSINQILEVNVVKIKELRTYIDSRLESSVQTINKTGDCFSNIVNNLVTINGEVRILSQSVQEYSSSSTAFAETLNQITKTTSNLGTASANCKLVQQNTKEFLKAVAS